MADEVKRCAECTCEHGGIFCNWIASTPRAYLAALTALQAQNRKLVEALKLAANRLIGCSLDYDTGTRQFIEVGEWAEEARAAIAEAEKGEG